MSKKLLLGLLLCIGLQAVKAAAPNPGQRPTAADQLNEAQRHFWNIGTNAIQALCALGRILQSTGLAVKHTGLAGIECTRETGARARDAVADSGRRTRTAAENARTNTVDAIRCLWNFTEPARNNPPKTIATLCASGLGLYGLTFVPTNVFKDVAKIGAGAFLAITGMKLMERKAGQPRA